MFSVNVLSISVVLATAIGSIAAPALLDERADTVSRRSVTQLTAAQLSALAPYTEFARAAYCPSNIIQGWQCGQACSAIPGFVPTLTGGDGNDVQLFYVGWWPSQSSVVVAHEGTDPTQLLSDLTDVEILQENLDPTLFPGIPSSVWVHSGFADEHALTATTILAEVKRLISLYGATQVIAIGHSLGGALAELDSLYLTLNLPSSIHVKGVTYGTPRVGNDDWATFFDSNVSDFERINNESDPIPIVPGRFLGYSHVHGEIHIVSPNNAYACSGDDDATDSQCTISIVPNILDSDILDHLGPYQGIYIGTIYCT